MIKNQIEDFRPISEKFNSIYRGVVKDIDDPLQSGRVRVRIFGIHTDITTKTVDEGIPDSELPWAQPALPIIGGAYSGKGFWGIPAVGSHVFIFFESGNHMQPRYFASVPGQGDWPTTSYPDLIRLKANGDQIIEFDGEGNIDITIPSDENATISGSTNITISGDANITIDGNCVIECSGNITVKGSTILLN
jgi:hypothetical protein